MNSVTIKQSGLKMNYWLINLKPPNKVKIGVISAFTLCEVRNSEIKTLKGMEYMANMQVDTLKRWLAHSSGWK